MRLAAVGFLAALLLAPLAAQAAQPTAEFAVTLRGTVVDRLTYERTTVDDECTLHTSGDGGRQLSVRSLRATTIEVTRGASGLVYRPARVSGLRVAATSLEGTFVELRNCRFLPPERRVGRCERAAGAVSRMRAGLRSRRNAIVFARPKPALAQVRACGLGPTVPGGWFHLVSGRIDPDTLIDGRSLRVVARASVTRENSIIGIPTTQGTQRTTVRWTLTFRRLS
jgi:hypothetical protein